MQDQGTKYLLLWGCASSSPSHVKPVFGDCAPIENDGSDTFTLSRGHCADLTFCVSLGPFEGNNTGHSEEMAL